MNVSEESVFAEALGKPDPQERAAYLDRACAGLPELRQNVESLLSAYEAGRFLEAPPALVATADESPLREGPGTRIGPYKLLEQIGEGGFGVVFMAEQQQPLRRKVALKVLKPGMDTRQVIARFEAERLALALMDHPNIARVLDAGTTQGEPGAVSPGRPYFVMELVKGMPITEYCDQNQFTPKDRLELFVSVCRAVQHAHQKGIIHRDLKPSNVLVTLHDGTPVVKVIDFGIAKALGEPLTDKTLFTGFAQLIGTPLYMSPEQAALSGLDVDTRSDIYALGVLLYELLTGTTPFDKERLRAVGYDELRRIIREEEPPKPSTRMSTLGPAAATVSAQRQSDPKRLSHLFQGELDWIVMKCLEKDRNRRYETANGLARDIARYLADEPVEAGPPSVGYKLRKFARRNRRLLATAAAFLVLLLLGVVGLLVALVAVNAEQHKTQAALEAERTAKAQARGALDALTDDVVETMFARQPELGETEKAFLRKVLESYEAITQEQGETAEARLLGARGFFKVAHLRALLGDQLQAAAGYGQAITLLDQLAADFPDVPEYRQKLATSHNNLGILLADLGREAEAETAFRQAIALRKQLVDDFPNVPPYRRELAGSYNDLGFLLKRLDKGPGAEEAYRQALDLKEQLVAEFPAVLGYRQALARSRTNLGGLLQEQGRYAEAEEVYRQALTVQQKQVDEFPAEPRVRRELADSYHGLAMVLAELGERADAETAFRQALDLRKRLTNDFPKVLQYRRELATGYNDLGLLLWGQGRYADAEKAYRQALELKEKVVAEAGAAARYRQELARSHNNLGNLLRDQQKYAEAEAAYRQTLDLRQKLADECPDIPRYRAELADTQLEIGHLLRLWQRPAEALTWYDRTLAMLQSLYHESSPDVAVRRLLRKAHGDRALALDILKRPTEALADWDRAVELAPPGDRPQVQLGRARGRAQAGKAAEAVADAEALTKDPATPSALCCEAAGVCSLASAAAKEARQREAYAGQALALLRRAQAAGFFKDHAKVEHLKQDADLEPLRSREDFQKFVAELEAAAAKD